MLCEVDNGVPGSGFCQMCHQCELMDTLVWPLGILHLDPRSDANVRGVIFSSSSDILSCVWSWAPLFSGMLFYPIWAPLGMLVETVFGIVLSGPLSPRLFHQSHHHSLNLYLE